MDTFFEQIVTIKKDAKAILALIGIWIAALLLSAVAFFLLTGMGFGPIAILAIAGILYGAYKLSMFFGIEYEYIVTNGTMDIDKIISKSSRKRMISFELPSVTSIEKYNPSAASNIDKKNLIFACNADDDNAYLMVCSSEGKGTKYIVFSPDERIKSAVVKFVPKFISNSAFK